MTDQFSTCCGASSSNPIYGDLSLCPECKEHCGWVSEDDETPVTFTPSYAEIATVAFIVIAMFVFGLGLNAVEGVAK